MLYLKEYNDGFFTETDVVANLKKKNRQLKLNLYRKDSRN
jgi:hypothetical protein